MKILKKFHEINEEYALQSHWEPPSKKKIESIEDDILNILQPILDEGYGIGYKKFFENGSFDMMILPSNKFSVPNNIYLRLESPEYERFESYFDSITKFSTVLYGNINEVGDRIRDIVESGHIKIYSVDIDTNKLSLRIQGWVL